MIAPVGPTLTWRRDRRGRMWLKPLVKRHHTTLASIHVTHLDRSSSRFHIAIQSPPRFSS